MSTCLPLLFSRGHLLICLEERLYLLDTASPVSLGEPFSFTLEGKTFSLEKREEKDPIQENKQQIEELVGRPFHALLGLDVLAAFPLILDLKNKLCLFNPETLPPFAQSLPLSFPMGRVLSIPLQVAGHSFQAVLDTGAPVSYIVAKYVQNPVPVGEAKDYSPLFGSFSTPLYDVVCLLGTEKRILRAGAMTPSLQVIANLQQTEAVLGPEFFKDKTLIFDFPSGFLHF